MMSIQKPQPSQDNTEALREQLRAQNRATASARPAPALARPASEQASPPPQRADLRRPVPLPSGAQSSRDPRRLAPAVAQPSRDPRDEARRPTSDRPAPKGDGGSFLEGVFDVVDERLPDGLPEFINGKAIVAVVLGLIVLTVVVGLILALSGGEGSATSTVAPRVTPVVVATPPPFDQGEDLVAAVLNAPQPEISPWLNGRLDNPLVFAGLLMALTIPLFCWADSKARAKVHPFAPTGALIAIVLGILGLPLANLASGNPIATLIASLLLFGTWILLVGLAIAYRDWTSVSTALMLTAVVGFVLGSFALPVGLGRLVDTTWPTWRGVTTLGGLTAYIMAFEFAKAAMTLYIYSVGVIAIILATVEMGKRQGMSGVVIIGAFTLILWVLASWGLDALFDRVFTGQMTPSALLAIEVLKPLIAWFLSVLVMALVGSRLGDDASISFGVNQIQLGLRGQTGIPTVADFLFAATVVGVFLTLIVRL